MQIVHCSQSNFICHHKMACSNCVYAKTVTIPKDHGDLDLEILISQNIPNSCNCYPVKIRQEIELGIFFQHMNKIN